MSDITLCDPIRLPLGLLGFSNIRKNKMIYVDKTKLIYEIARQRSPIFFSRPRRFGKSLLINTLASLFTNGLEDFHGLAIEKMWKDTTYKVVHFDFSRMAEKNAQDLKFALSAKILQVFGESDDLIHSNSPKVFYPDIILDDICSKLFDASVVLLVDEYDAPLTHHLNEPDELKAIMSVLNDFYATVKQYTDKFRFIFITGVTCTSHVSIFSAFNNLKNLSLDVKFNSLLGFTQDDLVKYFDPYIENASQILNMRKEDVYKRIEQYYDGFQFSLESPQTLYNPWSILNFLDSPENGFRNYWFKSGGLSSLVTQYLKISDSFDIINYKKREIFRTLDELSNNYEITNIPHDILLYQAGYFTLRNKSDDIASLLPPNTEVEDSLLGLYLTANNLQPNIHLSPEIDKLAANIDQKNLLAVVKTFNAIVNDCVSILSNIFRDERSVRDIIYAALPQRISLQKFKERETAKGYADLELLTRKTHMVIEFKRTNSKRNAKASLQAAIDQLQSKDYGVGAFQDHMLYRVAMVISTEEKKILFDFCKEIN